MSINSYGRLDPKIRFYVKKYLVDLIYEPTYKQFDERLANIIRSNTVNHNFTHLSFSYKGEFYTFEKQLPRFKNIRLMPELHFSMDEYLREKAELEHTEVPFVTALFTRALNSSNSFQDWYRLLPECVHKAMDHFRGPEWDPWHLPTTLTQEEVDQFHAEHQEWIMMLKKRMVLNLITV